MIFVTFHKSSSAMPTLGLHIKTTLDSGLAFHLSELYVQMPFPFISKQRHSPIHISNECHIPLTYVCKLSSVFTKILLHGTHVHSWIDNTHHHMT